jgi:hypothetical protein
MAALSAARLTCLLIGTGNVFSFVVQESGDSGGNHLLAGEDRRREREWSQEGEVEKKGGMDGMLQAYDVP